MARAIAKPAATAARESASALGESLGLANGRVLSLMKARQRVADEEVAELAQGDEDERILEEELATKEPQNRLRNLEGKRG